MCKSEISRLWLNDLDRIRTPDTYYVAWFISKYFIFLIFIEK